jgi:hypothetical protein
MKLLLKTVFVLITILSFTIIERAQSSPKFVDAFDPSGDYHPVNRPTEESEKFIQFDLQVRRKKGKLVAWGEVRGVQPWYKFTSVFVTDERLKFSTAKVGAVSYNFDGKFVGKGNFASESLGNGIVMLEGILRKFVNGKQSWEINTAFIFYPGC